MSLEEGDAGVVKEIAGEGGGDGNRSAPAPGAGRINIYDVAARAGVSISTVSNALNRPQRVGAASLARVMAAIDELGFVPKATAVSQARRGVGRVGVMAPFSSYESYRSRLVGVLEACSGHALEVVVFDEESAAEATSPLVSSLPTTGRLDGLLIMGLPLRDAMAERLARRMFPTVLVDSHHPLLTSVTLDDESGGRMVGEYLLGLGARSFVYLSERQRSADFLSQGQRRFNGFIGAVAAAGLDPGSVRHVITSHDVAGGSRAAGELVDSGALPDAIFAHFDEIAAGLVSGLRARGVSVPGDVAVVGYDDGSLAAAMELTTVRQPFAETGRVGTGLLLDELRSGQRTVQHVMLQPELVIRRTT